MTTTSHILDLQLKLINGYVVASELSCSAVIFEYIHILYSSAISNV